MTTTSSPPNVRGNRLHQVRKHPEVVQIGGQDERSSTTPADLISHLVELRAGPGHDGDVGARLGETDRNAGPDPFAGAGDDGDLVRHQELLRQR